MQILELDTCKSTNLVARWLLDNNDYADVIATRKQTQGKGRSGNWFSPEDCGIYMSVIRSAHADPDVFTESVGIRLAMLLQKYFQLLIYKKGINDLYIDNKKLGGILCEYHAASDKLIIGLGLNTYKPTKVRKDLLNSAVWLNEYASETRIIHKELVKMIAEEILSI